MNKDQYLGLIREGLAAVGVLLITFGATALNREAGADGETIAQLGIGAIMAIISLFWSIAAHEDAGVVKTLTRKALSAVAGFLTGVGWLAPDKADALFGLVVALLPIGWSIYEKGKLPAPPSGTSVALALMSVAATLSLPSCAGLTGAITGQPIPSTSVQRVGHPDAPIVQVASSDLAQAELGPAETIHGLYDAGRVAAVAREVFTESSK